MATGQFPPVGNPASASQLDQKLSNAAVLLEQLYALGGSIVTEVTANGGLAYLEQLGYSNAAGPSNPNNPQVNGTPMTDAAYAQAIVNYMATMMGVYDGTATQASEFDFRSAMSILRAGSMT
jgi:hypothetical protein